MKLYYFHTDEFRGQKNKCAPALLLRLDTFRHIYGQSVIISPHPNALGRTGGESWHNMVKHAAIMAVDILPKNLHRDDNPYKAIQAAKLSAFTGIGIYPHWTLNGETVGGLHVDVRTTHHPADPATWGGIDIEGQQTYVSLNEALNYFK